MTTNHEQGPGQPRIGRRSFVTHAAAVGAGVGLSATALAAFGDDTSDPKTSSGDEDISLRDQDLKFIGVEETFSTPELMKLNSISQDHYDFLESLGLAELGEQRIGAMDEGGLNVQILSTHTPSVQNVPGKRASTSPIVSTGRS